MNGAHKSEASDSEDTELVTNTLIAHHALFYQCRFIHKSFPGSRTWKFCPNFAGA